MVLIRFCSMQARNDGDPPECAGVRALRLLLLQQGPAEGVGGAGPLENRTSVQRYPPNCHLLYTATIEKLIPFLKKKILYKFLMLKLRFHDENKLGLLFRPVIDTDCTKILISSSYIFRIFFLWQKFISFI